MPPRTMAGPAPAGLVVNAPPATTADSVLERWQACWAASPKQERRTATRLAVDTQVELVPLSLAGEPSGPMTLVECLDVSRGGLRIRHAQPLTAKTVALALPFGNEPGVRWIARLTWCRFTHEGAYESGGVILRVIDR